MQFTSPKFNGVGLLQQKDSGPYASSWEPQVQVAGGSQAASSSEAVNLVISAPKTTEQLIGERMSKRASKKSEVRQKAEGHKLAGDALFQSRNYKAAYPQYLSAIELWGSVPEYYISLAAVYRKLEWYEEAAHAATRALTMDPKNSEARYVRGVARLEQRLLKPAQTDFETVLQYEPAHLRARTALVEVNQFIASSSHLGDHDLGTNPVDGAIEGLDFSFPHYDYEALEVASVSDSSDCQHVGNGVPCRFYNHQGCARGTACAFSHAPDEKSVRDELGRNVCIYHLLDSCKFGMPKCVYSHSKEALPNRGWWTSPEKVAKVKAVLEVAETNVREQRHLENEKWKAHLKTLKASGKPPKSAGVGGPSKKATNKEEKKDGESGEEVKETAESKEPMDGKETKEKKDEDSSETVDEQKKKEGAKAPKSRRYAGKKKAAAVVEKGNAETAKERVNGVAPAATSQIKTEAPSST